MIFKEGQRYERVHLDDDDIEKKLMKIDMVVFFNVCVNVLATVIQCANKT